MAPELTARLGAFSLRPAQQDARRRILDAFAEFGGALLADPPGTGKTIVALAAVQAEATRTAAGAGAAAALVIAPAALRDQWMRAASRAGVPIRYHSLESLSRSAEPGAARIVIVDEAHHARNPATRRYARLAACCVGARVLLLSATPVVNRGADRDALLALFLGARAARLAADELARCVIRRATTGDERPSVRRLPPLQVGARLPGLASALRALPPPLPAADGSTAAALVRISLAMAWSSSLAALDAALRRRTQRGLALADALEAGRWPTRDALRRWIVHADATQLAFPALMPPDTAGDHRAMRATLRAHLDAVGRLRALIRPHLPADTAARAAALCALRREHPARRVAVFARHADTIRALWRSLRAEPGVVAITGARAMAAHGRWTRAELLEAVGPYAAPLREDDPLAIRMVLATDLLAEGVELQGIGILVHADRTWTPARHEQREGRIARIGARAHEVLVTRFLAPPEAGPLLRLGARLARKQRARREAVASAEVEALVAARRREWGTVVGRPLAPPTHFLAALRIAGRVTHVAGRRTHRGWHVTLAPGPLRTLVQCRPVSMSPEFRREARRALARWSRRRSTGALLRAPAPAGRISATKRAVRGRVDRAIRSTPFAHRAERARALGRALGWCDRNASAGLESVLARLHRAATSDDDFADALVRLAARHGGATRQEPGGGDPRSRLVALYAFAPGSPAESAGARSDISLAV
jgi:hypothetical protein